jgi:hypothetical protein
MESHQLLLWIYKAVCLRIYHTAVRNIFRDLNWFRCSSRLSGVVERTNAHSNPFTLRGYLHPSSRSYKKFLKVSFQWNVLYIIWYGRIPDSRALHRSCTEWVECSGFVYSTWLLNHMHSNYARYESTVLAPSRVLDFGIRCRMVRFRLRTLCL